MIAHGLIVGVKAWFTQCFVLKLEFKMLDSFIKNFAKNRFTVGLLTLYLSWGSFFTLLWTQIFYYSLDQPKVAGYQPIWAGAVKVWADWSAHLAYASVFAQRPAKLWFTAHPLYQQAKFTYPFLADLISGLLMKIGLNPVQALVWPSIFTTFFLLTMLYVFYYHWLRSETQALVATTIFLAGGGLGFIYFFSETSQLVAQIISQQLSWSALLNQLINPPHEYTYLINHNIEWLNIVTGQLLPQRAFLLGFPWTLVVITWLLVNHRSHWRRVKFWQTCLMAIWSALLLIVHVHSFLVLGLIGLVYAVYSLSIEFCKFKKKRLSLVLFRDGLRWRKIFKQSWFQWGVLTTLLALPLFSLFYQTTFQTSFFEWYPGWLATHEPHFMNPALFWILNWGAWWPIFLLALIKFSKWRRDFLVIAAIVIFILANFILFQPHDWDNSKILAWVYLIGVGPITLWLTSLWKSGIKTARLLTLILFGVLTLSGFLDIFYHTRTDQHGHQLLSVQDQIRADFVIANTSPQAVFLTADSNSHWVTTLTGRQIVMGYRGWLWTYNIDYQQTSTEITQIYQARSPKVTRDLLAKHRIDYLVIGPAEKAGFQGQPNQAFFESNYPLFYQDKTTMIYQINPEPKNL